MVSVTQPEGECPFLKQNTSSEQSKCHQVTLRGIRTHLYLFGASAKFNGDYIGFSCTAEEQSLLESLILSQWEDRAWKGQVSYDVSSCEIKVIHGGKKFIAQLNEKWNLNSLKEFGNKALQPSGLIKPSYMRSHREDILFCVASGVKETSELIPSTMLPKDGTLIIVNANPIEYGHVFLVPYGMHQSPRFFDKRTFEMIAQMAVEVNNRSFCAFYEYSSSTNSNHMYFQGSYFADPLPVELISAIPVHGNLVTKGMCICEVADYPLKALVFVSENPSNALVELVAEICSALQVEDTAFNLLISDRGTKMFLFPQVHRPDGGRHLSTWECGGYFVYNTKANYDQASEVETSERLASVSLDDDGFQALKQLCCGIAVKLAP